MMFGGNTHGDQAVPMIAAAVTAGMAAALPSQPANLRGSEVTKNITEEFLKDVTETAAQQIAETESTDIMQMVTATGAKTMEAMAMQAAIAASTMAAKAVIKSCQRRATPTDGPNRSKEEIHKKYEKVKQMYGKNTPIVDKDGNLVDVNGNLLITPTNPNNNNHTPKAPSYHNMSSRDHLFDDSDSGTHSLDLQDEDYVNTDQRRKQTDEWIKTMQEDNQMHKDNSELLDQKVKTMEAQNQETQNVLKAIMKHLETSSQPTGRETQGVDN